MPRRLVGLQRDGPLRCLKWGPTSSKLRRTCPPRPVIQYTGIICESRHLPRCTPHAYSSSKDAQLSLSCAIRYQSNVCPSMYCLIKLSMSSRHLAFGCPTLLFPPSGSQSSNAVDHRLSVLLAICPAHLHFSTLLLVIQSSISAFLDGPPLS